MVELLSGVVGVDEAGRGPLAGPVVAAAVLLPDDFNLKGLNDSKKLSPAQRETLEIRIKETATWAISSADPTEIDRLNILWASMLAMERAVAKLHIKPIRIMVDGNRIPENLGAPAEAVIKGDGKIASIAAASILAKTCRDRLMVQYAKTYPEYGFEQHFGYPTPDHLEAIRKHGPCPIHRMTFAPLKPQDQPCLIFDE
jgi:ribonuclease HII